MKKNMLMMFGALALAMAGVSANAATVVRSGRTFIPTVNLGSGTDDLNVDLYFNTSFKINDSYVLTPEILTNVSFLKGGEGETAGKFGFLRFVLSGPVLKKWSEKRTFKLEYRYAAPLDVGSQLAGSYGAFGVRPVISWNFNDNLSFLGRGMTQVLLQRNGYQVNRPNTKDFTPSSYKGVPAGNSVFVTSPEFVLEYAFAGKFAVYTYWAPAFILKARAQGADSVTWTKLLSHQHAVTYKVSEALTLDVGAKNEDVPMAKGFKLFSKASNVFYAEAQYKF